MIVYEYIIGEVYILGWLFNVLIISTQTDFWHLSNQTSNESEIMKTIIFLVSKLINFN